MREHDFDINDYYDSEGQKEEFRYYEFEAGAAQPLPMPEIMHGDYSKQPEFTNVTALAVPQKAPKWKKKIVALAVGLTMFSLIMGAGGGFLAGMVLFSNTQTENTNSTVTYKPVIRTASSDTINVSDTLSIQEVVALTENSVVEISTETVVNSGRMGQYVNSGAGSGVIAAEDGYILTNNHVIEGAKKITVRTKDGVSYEAQLIGTDEKTDVAVLKIEASGLVSAVFGNSDNLIVGETAIAIGNPLGELGGTVTNGIISALDRDIIIDGTSMKLLQTSASINPGNSGGGLFNAYGELIGLVNAKSSGSGIEGLGFAIPANTVRDVMDQLINYGYVRGRVSAGIQLIDITDFQTAMMYRVQSYGVYVYQMIRDDTNLQTGDRIISVDGKEITSSSDFTKLLESHSVGDVLAVTISRDNNIMEVSLTLVEEKK